MTKAYSYLRFSTPEQAKGDSTRRQTELARVYAQRHSLELDESLTFRDMGVSGFTGTNVRNGALGQFLKVIDEGLVEPGSYLLVENLDRVSRQNPWDAMPVLQQIVNAGVTIVTLQDERVWSQEEFRANPWRVFESLLVMIRAHEESATKSRRLKSSWQNKRAQAASKPLTARGPAWLRLEDGKRWEVIEDRAEVVRRIFEMTASGVGHAKIASTLNQEQVPTFGDGPRKPAKHWHRTYIAKILASPSVIGMLVPYTIEHISGQKVRREQASIENYYPPVIDRVLYDSVRALREGSKSPRRGRHADQAVRNVLGGLAKCPLCGGTMTRVSKGATTRAGRPYLVCRGAKVGAGCRYRAVRCDDIEACLVANADWIEATGPVGASRTEIERQLQDNLAEQEERKARIARLVVAIEEAGPSPAINSALSEAEQSLRILKTFEQDLRDRAVMADGPILRKRLGNLKDALGADPLDPQRVNLALRMLLTGVVVDYRSGLLLLRWKHGGESQLRFAQPEPADSVPEQWKAAAQFFERTRGVPMGDQPAYMPLAKLGDVFGSVKDSEVDAETDESLE